MLENKVPLKGQALTPTPRGSLNFNPNGSFSYTPDAGFVGTDSFTYQASDQTDKSAVTTVSITVEENPGGNTPNARNDRYNTVADTPLTVSVDDGVLSNDTDADGDIVSATIASQPSNGSVEFNEDGSFTYTPETDFVGNDSFTYTATDSTGLSDNATVSITVGEDDLPVVSIETSTDFSGEANALVEDQGSLLTVDFSLSEPAPADGLRVFVDSEVEQIVNRLDLPGFASNPVATNVEANSFVTDFNNSGFALTIEPGATTASFTIPVFDNVEPSPFLPTTFDGLVNATFSVTTSDQVSARDQVDIVGIDEYLVSDTDGSSTVTFVDTESQLDIDGGGDPVVSFSTTPDIISEAEGTSLVLDFSVDGEIPEGGITVNLEGDTPEILQQFIAPDGDGAVQTRVTAEGNVLYRFDTSFEADNDNFANIEGGILDVFALEDGDPAEDNSDPAAAGTGFLSDFSFTITEPTASITLPVSDDLIAEPDQTFTYTLVDGDGYEVDGETNSGTFTVTDGVPDGVGPTVGVTAEPTTLVEQDQTRIELTFTTEGDIPADGLVVTLEGDAVRAIAEFDVTASNPRDPEDEIEIEGPIVEGGNIVGTDETASSLIFRITEPTATLSVAVFEDIVPEGTETINFTLLNGEEYEVNADASGFTVTIEDGGIIGTDGADTIVGDDMDNSIDAMAGDDLVAGLLGDDVILGGDGDDVLRGDANSRASSTGAGGDDIIFGGAGNDRIGGKDGNDLLSGDAGDDMIFGDAGDDTIMGVTGNDTLTGDDFSGGNGSDLFIFGNGDGTDTITDFEVGTDLIGLVEDELTFEDIEIITIDGDAAISVMETGETLAILNGVDADELTADAFVITPDVSSLNDLI
ncbi:MAG: tandem-95 repeat protein [Microcoleaceae cyanobacterium]